MFPRNPAKAGFFVAHTTLPAQRNTLDEKEEPIMSGGWKSEHDENIIRIERASTIRGVTRVMRRIHARYAGTPGKTWNQGEIERTARKQREHLRGVRSWLANLKLPDW